MSAARVRRAVDELADPAQARELQRFFKTGPGEYAEGDVFVGVKVPPLRKIARANRDLSLDEVAKLLASAVHEHRTVGLVIITDRAAKGDLATRQELYDFYLAHADRVNNWDLVDISCREIVGAYLLKINDFAPLDELVADDDLWRRRIGIISTWKLIRGGFTEPTFRLVASVEDDPRDLTHKACGWMLREAGIKEPAALDAYLKQPAATMPRTTLRYAIEKMTKSERAHWMAQRATEQKEAQP